MTNIKLYARKGGDIFGMQVKGHAGFGVRGTDVVCASVSILVINTINSIQKLTSDKCNEKVNARKATIDFEIDGDEKKGVTRISFMYYLNPTPLDRNLEWDMKNNLCPNPGSLSAPMP